jgi:hypothetical protein
MSSDNESKFMISRIFVCDKLIKQLFVSRENMKTSALDN